MLATSLARWSLAAFSVSMIAALTGCQGLSRTDSGNSPPQASLSTGPASLSFGNVVIGQSASLKSSFKASGAAVTISSMTATNNEFAVSGISFPISIDDGQSLPFTVTFAPQLSGSARATLSFISDASDSPAVQSEDGNGTPPPSHGVDLSWNPSQSSGVVGYNVYRGTGGPYSKINSTLEAATAYNDSLVTAGATYYYVVTAVDENGSESGSSNQVTALIPTP